VKFYLFNSILYLHKNTARKSVQKVNYIIFDLGGVLVDWDPEYLYKKLFTDQKEMRHFLSHICTPDWNEQQDAGRRLLEATDILVEEHPHYETEIRAFYGRWAEMLGGPIQGTVEILQTLINKKIPVFALTNWSAETYPIAHSQYDFLQWFEDIIVSGHEGIRKPFAEIYQLAGKRFGVKPKETLFIDDNLRNIKGAQAVGFQTIHFKNPTALKKELIHLGILP